MSYSYKSAIRLFTLSVLVALIVCTKSRAQCPIPTGDQITSGDGSWIGYVYANTDGANPPANAFTTTYRGYITESEEFDHDFGTGSVSGANVCGSYSDSFAIRYKMRHTFTPGYYQFTVGGDSGYRFSLDGGNTFVFSNWNDHAYTTNSAVFSLSGEIDLVVEYYENNGPARVSFSFDPCAEPSTAPTLITSNDEVCSGSPITLVASGGYEAAGAVYQWGSGNVIGSNIISGQTTATATFSPTSNITYWVRRIDSGSCGFVSGGISKTITVSQPSVAPSSITGNTAVCYQHPTTLTAAGYSGSIQWMKSTDNTSYAAIAGATGPSLTTENLTANIWYKVRVSNGSCASVASSPILVTVSPLSHAGTVSGTATVCAGTNNSTLTATPSVGSVQWQKSTDNATFSDISGATSNNYTATNLTVTTYFRIKATSGSCEAAFSNSVSVIVNPNAVAGTVTGATSLCAGANSATLSVSGQTGSIQWQSSVDNTTFASVSNATSASYQANNLTQTTYFRVMVSNGTCPAVYSTSVTITVSPQPVTGTISGGTTVCSGTNSTALSITGYTGSLQWQISSDNTTFADIASATASTFTATNLTATRYYRVKVSSGSCTTAYSASASVVVSAASVAGTAAGTATICSATNSTVVSVSGQTGNIQWQSSSDNSTFNDISGATSSSYTATNISATTYYRAKVTNGACSAVFSNSITLTFSAPIPGTISGATTVCTGTNSTVLTLAGFSGTIQWQTSTDNTTFSDIASAASSAYTVTNIFTARYYRVKITNGSCGSAFSPSVLMSVNSNTNGGTAAITGQSVTTITVPATYNSNAFTVSGYSGTAIQWQSSTDNVTFANISGATTANYTATNVAVTTYFRAAVSTGSCVGYSNVLTLQTCTPTGTPTVYGTGNTWRAYFYAQNDGANPPVTPFGTYQGYYTTGAFAFDNYPYNNMASTVCSALWTNFKGSYRYRLTKNFVAGNYMFMVGSNGGYRLSIDGGATWIVNHWTSTATGTFNTEDSAWFYLSGNVNIVIEFYNLSTYNPRHYFNYCSDIDSNSVTAPTSIVANDVICLGGNTTILAKGGTGSSYQWGTGSVIGANTLSSTGSAIIVAPTTTTTYWVRRYNPVCETYTAGLTQTITVNPLSAPTPAGNTTDYGNGTWIGYVYASKNGSAGTATTAFGGTGSNYAYMGYVTTPSDVISLSGGIYNSPPTPISGTNICSTYYSNFSIRYKMRKTFTPGYYNFTITADDGMRFSIDGGVTWVITRWAYVTNGLTNTYSVFLSGQKDLIIEYIQASSTFQLSFNYTSCTNYSTAPTSITGTTNICAGSSTTLTAAGGTVAPNTTYEWGTGTSVGTNVLPFTTESITVTPAANTTYWVRRKNGGLCQETVGTNTAGAYTTGVTANVTLSALSVAGSISGGNNTVCAGTNSTALSLSGHTGTIQWQSSPDNATWGNISSATAATYTATNLSATTYFRAALTNGACSTVYTNSVNVIVIPASVSGTISGTTTVCSGLNSTALSLSGYTGTIQWQSSLNNSSFTNISGATSATYTATNLSATTYYRVVVSSGSCASATSASVQVTVTPVSVAGTVSGSAEVCSGTNSTTLTASGYTGSIQWQSSANNSSFSNITGATLATYTASNLSATTYYRVFVTNGVCSGVASASASVTVNPTPTTGTISGAGAVCYGTNSTVLTVSGSSGSIQWQSSANNSSFSDISGATSASYTVTNLTSTMYYRIRVTNGPCSATMATSVAITVDPASVAGVIGGAASVCSGVNSTVLTLSGHIGSIQWKSSTDNVTFTNITGANSATYNATNLNVTTYYKAFLTSGVCSTASTASVMIFVRPASVAGAASGDTTLCVGVNQATMAVSGYTGNIQWQQSANGSSFSDISGATSASYTAYNLQATRYFRAIVTTTECSSATTNVVTVQVLPYAQAGSVSITGTTLPSTNVCSGTNSTNLTLTGSAGDIQWQSSPDNVTFTDIPGASSSTYLAAGLTSTLYFRTKVVSGSCGATQYSDAVLINVPTAVTYNGSWSGTPNTTTTIVIGENLSLNSSLNVCSCQVTGTATMSVPAGITLVVQKNVVVDPSAHLILENNASLVQVDDSSVNSGSITVRRKTTAMKTYDFTYWSSPVADNTLHDLSPNTLSDKYYSFNPQINNWQSIAGGNATMVPGMGYIIRAPQGWSNTNASNGIYSGEFKGVPNNGFINATIQKATSTYNLIGNPYPSAIDIDLFLTDPANENIVEGTVYLWTHNTAIAPATVGFQYTTNDYAKYNLTGGIKTASAALSGGAAPTGKIASGQAFFIEANNELSPGSYSALFKNAMRVSGNNTQFFRTSASNNETAMAPEPEKSRIWLSISNENGAFEETLVGYVPGATNEKDSKFDGTIFPAGNYVSLYSMLDAATKLAIQGRALPFNNNDVVPLGYKTTVAGTLSINLENVDGIFTPQGIDIYILDKADNSYHDIRLGSYSFTSVVGTFDDRFELHYTTQSLGTGENTANPAYIIAKDHEIQVSSAGQFIKSVAIFDVTGKHILEDDKLNTNLFSTGKLNVAAQVLIVKAILEDGSRITQKVIID
ncbi:hypothetical protein [Flavobacterium silvaticum]|uniref:T9SS type A sorting domain-containing protein n=1 Tax=Flavobacterium silvaticum TaxID=1852020 RepID=A0A972G0C3_9FLAO|nr:hypothetical protein [Flavobacterium silvaticum]NMH28116.1 hypothetical protein [Flavobacterium silvaticum]